MTLTHVVASDSEIADQSEVCDPNSTRGQHTRGNAYRSSRDGAGLRIPHGGK